MNSSRVSAPAMQPVHACMSALVCSSMFGSAMTSETANRPPGLSTRAVSRRTLGLSAERLITQLEMTTSTLSWGRGMSSMWPRNHSTLVTPASAWLRRARSSISSVMSSP